MRGAPTRTSEALLVSPADSFGWSASTIATLRHCSLPWYDGSGPPFTLAATPLTSTRDLGGRDRLSLVAQFAAHQAFLQFAGIADGEFDAADWAIVRKRATDCRLVRVAARANDPVAAPPVLALIHQFADAIAAEPLDVFRQSWARAETAYVEAREILSRDVAADLRWVRRSAAGEILAPGPDALREIWSGTPARYTYADNGVHEALTLLASLDRAVTLVVLGCDFPLHRYGGLAPIDERLVGSGDSEAVVAEIIAARLAEHRHVVLVGQRIDVGSNRAIEIASSLGSATWVFASNESEMQPTRWFVLTPRMSWRKSLDEQIAGMLDPRPWIESFVDSDAYLHYLASGEMPAADTFAAVHEPKRSYIAALSLLGARIPAGVAKAFLAEFLFDQPLEDLVASGVTRFDGDVLVFESETVREQCARHIPRGSRAALCRAAASATDGARAAFLLIDAGDVAEGIAILEVLEAPSAEETVACLSRVPLSALSVTLAQKLARAYIACARYRDAAAVVPLLQSDEQELLLAKCDRRSGDYETAFSRLDRITTPNFEAALLRCELLRLNSRYSEAAAVLSDAQPASEAEFVEASYEASLLALETGQPCDATWSDRDHYLAARFLTYRALTDSDFASAEQLARDALRLARSPVERIDAWLDLVFAAFSAGDWTETRILGLEALTVIEETQGDRAASGILFTLAYLAADEGHWHAARSTLDRLRHYYSATNDAERLFELKLIEAHLHFCRCELDEARRLAEQTLERDALLPQIREAAALIVDEINDMQGHVAPIRSTGGSGNRELTDRHCLIADRRGIRTLEPRLPFNIELARWQTNTERQPPPCSKRSESLKLLRAATASGRQHLAQKIAQEIGVSIPAARAASTSDETDMLRIAATAEYPFAPNTFGPLRWAHATRNRLGHWIVEGNAEFSDSELDRVIAEGETDWTPCGEREVVFVEGSRRWPPATRDAIASIFRTRAENHRLRRLVEQDDIAPGVAAATGLHGMVGESPAIGTLFDTVHRVARRDVPVCILGESGTGKELVARAVHRESPRRHKPFVAVNCAALPENLIESELFGHVRGAFTGADRDRAGLIETSDGGSLFLDEIGEMPLIAQAKLLRFLQDGEFRRVGDATNRASDVRVITATNRRLDAAVDEGRFREDLYYRIRGIEIALPPLRERANDILLLARHFLTEERTKHRGGPAALSPDVESLFRSYRWPGNIRELQNTVRAAHAMAGEAREITIEHLPERLRSVVPSRVMAGSYQDAVAKFRRELIEKSLLEAGGNQNRAAALLNMSRQALAYQIRELGILIRQSPLRPV